jgi:putative nucleotidyltransferase with HDIG domain
MIDAKLAAEVERLVLARVAAGRINVPAIGVVAMRCLDVLRAKDFDVRRLVKEIEKEPMIAVMIMRTANAAVYGGHAVTKLEQAAVRLGTARLEVVILEYAARKVFAATGPFAAANRKIWEHSVAVARVSREIASYVGRQDADAYYLAGLLHDIGKPVVAALLLETQRKVAPGIATWLDQETWDRVITNTHHQAAQLVGKAWKLPDAIMVGREPSYDLADRRSLANIVRMANAMAKHEGFTTGPVDHAELVVTIASGSTIVGIDAAVVDRIGVRLQEPLE